MVAALTIASCYMMSPMLFSTTGLKVVGVSSGASCGGMRVGDIITNVGGTREPSVQVFEAASKAAKAGDRIAMVVNGGPGGCTAVAGGDIGITAEVISRGWVRLGTDVAGGDKFAVTVTQASGGETPADIANVIERRLGVVGVDDARTSVDGNVIYAYVPKGDSVNSVMFPGRLDCMARQEASLSNGTASVKIGDTRYSFSWDGRHVNFEGVAHAIGEAFDVGGVRVTVSNFTSTSLTVNELIFDNAGVKKLEGSKSHVAYDAASMSYVFSVPVELSNDSSERFSDVVGGLDPLYGSTQSMLNGILVYSVDGAELSRLSIPSSILDSQVTALSMTGGEKTLDNALYKKKLLDMSLAGMIAGRAEASGAGAFEGDLGWTVAASELFVAGCMAALLAAVLVLHRNVKLSLFAMMVPALEIFLIVSVAEMSQALAEKGWVIDSLTLAGMCAFAALSALQTVLLTEKVLKPRFSKHYTWLSAAVIAVGAALSFTPLNRLGLALAFGGVLGYAVVKPFYEEYAAQFRR